MEKRNWANQSYVALPATYTLFAKQKILIRCPKFETTLTERKVSIACHTDSFSSVVSKRSSKTPSLEREIDNGERRSKKKTSCASPATGNSGADASGRGILTKSKSIEANNNNTEEERILYSKNGNNDPMVNMQKKPVGPQSSSSSSANGAGRRVELPRELVESLKSPELDVWKLDEDEVRAAKSSPNPLSYLSFFC